MRWTGVLGRYGYEAVERTRKICPSPGERKIFACPRWIVEEISGRKEVDDETTDGGTVSLTSVQRQGGRSGESEGVKSGYTEDGVRGVLTRTSLLITGGISLRRPVCGSGVE